LQERIGTDVLPAGTVLPSSRELAARLSVSRATVVAAYERLAAHGLIRSRAGIGTIVIGKPSPAPAKPAASPLRPRAIWRAEQLAVPDLTMPVAEFNFAPGVPARTQFPFARWRALLNDQLRTRTEVNYADPAGSERLRTTLARHLIVSRGVRIAPEQLVITTGAQQVCDIAARVLLEPGDMVAIEDPGYLPAYRGFLAHGARVVGVPVDSEGLVVDRIPAETRLVYATPSHQFRLEFTGGTEARPASPTSTSASTPTTSSPRSRARSAARRTRPAGWWIDGIRQSNGRIRWGDVG
jgi:GntR family transcriptional regulator / MocR family aminotransferase